MKKLIFVLFAIFALVVMVAHADIITYDSDNDGTVDYEQVYPGYLRVGTGSTPSVTPGNDDVFIEGTLEVDGATRIDGAFTTNSTIAASGATTYTVPAAGQAIIVDAETTINTGTGGVIDLGGILSTSAAKFMFLDIESEADGAGEIVKGIEIQMDDDADNADNEIHGINIGSEGNGTGLQHAIVVDDTGIDAAFYAHNGYVRIGTGATPDVTPGDDDLFVEGTVEVDGAARFDGAVTFNGGQTRMINYYPNDFTLDGTAPPTLIEFGTDGQAQVGALSFDADGGSTGDDIAYINWVVPDGYVVDSARLNVFYTFSTAEDAADEAQFDFTVNAVAAGEAIDAAGTALADQTTVISDASADNGKLHITQYNIEVEDIAVNDLVTIEVAVDESASALANSGTLDVAYVQIEYESTE